MSDERAAKNTDRELWRERPDDHYSDSVHVTQGGGIGINCGGYVVVKTLREWHKLALAAPVPASEPRFESRLSVSLYRSLERLSIAIEACGRIGFEESTPTKNENHAQVWIFLNEAQADAKLKLKHYQQLVSRIQPGPAEPNPFEPEESEDQINSRIGRMIRENVDKRLGPAAAKKQKP